MTTQEKIQFLYSKFIASGSKSSTFNSEIWTQGDQIPEVCPQFNQAGEYVNSNNELILKKYEYVKLEAIVGYPSAFSSQLADDIVSYEAGFDISYTYRFYTKTSANTYVEIPVGKDDYFLDHDTGILFFAQDRSLQYNPASLYISFIKYAGTKGLNTLSQFPGYPQYGPTGPTGPSGITGETGPTDTLSIRYLGTWNSSVAYAKWNIVKYNNKFFISTANTNTYLPGNGTYWQPFGVPQLSSGFVVPTNAYYISPSFVAGGGLFNNIESAFNDINSQISTDISIVVYPGNYIINNNITVRADVNINIIFYGNSTISFRDDSLFIAFTNSRVELRGSGFTFTNGTMRLNCSEISSVGGTLPNVELITTNLSTTSRLMATNSTVLGIVCYGSFVSLKGTNVINQLILDEVSVVHIEQCLISANPIGYPDQEKIVIVSCNDSGTPPGFGYEQPTLFIKNSRILSNDAVLLSAFAPLYGFKLGLLASSLYVKDQSTSFLNFSDSIETYVFGTITNTVFDDTKLTILNVDQQIQVIDAMFED